jgi:hypothetical protein
MSSFLHWVADSGVVQGVIIGLTFAYLSTVLILDAVATTRTKTVNGWSAIRNVGQSGNGVLLRAAMQKALPVVNVFEEAAYWTSTRDYSGVRFDGNNAYRLHFPAGQVPPNAAFWSLTATDTVGYMVNNATGHSSLNSHSDLVTNADGSIDLFLQSHQPSDALQNWIMTPPGRFKLMLRAYLPGAGIVNGDYQVPPVKKVGS